jgi:hypothetical protein
MVQNMTIKTFEIRTEITTRAAWNVVRVDNIHKSTGSPRRNRNDSRNRNDKLLYHSVLGFPAIETLSLSVALEPSVGPWPLFRFLKPIYSRKTPWTGISPSQGSYLHTEHKHRINAHRHPYLECDSNPRCDWLS